MPTGPPPQRSFLKVFTSAESSRSVTSLNSPVLSGYAPVSALFAGFASVAAGAAGAAGASGFFSWAFYFFSSSGGGAGLKTPSG